MEIDSNHTVLFVPFDTWPLVYTDKHNNILTEI